MESTEKEQKGRGLGKSFLISFIAILVVAALATGLNAAGIPSWPFMFFLLYFFTFAGTDKTRVGYAAIGGVIGLAISYSNNMIAYFTGNELYGLVGFLILVIVAVGFMISGKAKFIDPMCLLMITCLSGFNEVLVVTDFFKVLLSLVLGIVIFYSAALILAKQRAHP